MRKPVLFLAVSSMTFVTCARGPEGNPVAPRMAGVVVSDDGAVRASAVGDEKTGPGDLEIFNVRMDRQNARTGASILRQYANPGQTYAMLPGEQIELWVEYRGANNPRVTVDWGAGEADRQDGHVCGTCRLYHTYPRAGVFTVVVTLNDLAGTTVRRTFTLNSLPPRENAVLNLAFLNNAFCGETARLTGPGGLDCTRTGGTTGGTCSATFGAGTSVTLNYSVNQAFPCTVFNGWFGACAGVGTGALFGSTASCTLTLPAGVTNVSVNTFNDD